MAILRDQDPIKKTFFHVIAGEVKSGDLFKKILNLAKERNKVDCLDSEGASALLYASSPSTVKSFMESQADLTLTDSKGRNFFHYTNHLKKEYLKLYSQYLSKGKILEMVQQKDSAGKTSIEVCMENNTDVVKNSNKELVEKDYNMLLQKVLST